MIFKYIIPAVRIFKGLKKLEKEKEVESVGQSPGTLHPHSNQFNRQ